MRREIERFDLVAFGDFFDDLEFSVAVPEEPGLLEFLVPRFRGLDVELEPFAGERALFALGVEPAQCPETKGRSVQGEEREEKITDQQAWVSAQCPVQLVDKRLHFGAAGYNNFSCPANN